MFTVSKLFFISVLELKKSAFNGCAVLYEKEVEHRDLQILLTEIKDEVIALVEPQTKVQMVIDVVMEKLME